MSSCLEKLVVPWAPLISDWGRGWRLLESDFHGEKRPESSRVAEEFTSINAIIWMRSSDHMS